MIEYTILRNGWYAENYAGATRGTVQAGGLVDSAAEISRQTGKDIPYRNLPQAEYAAVLKGVGLPDAFSMTGRGQR